MKRLLLFLFFISMTLMQSHAQGIGGFFSQQSSKRKIMGQQIAYLQIYLHEIKSGYAIAEKGLETARQLKDGTFMLHSGYFQSLGQVAPVIRNNPKGKAMADLQQQLISLFSNEISWQKKEKQLTQSESAYLQQVSDHLLKESSRDMDELLRVLTPGKLQLTDKQRLERLDHLYEAMKDKHAFAGSFTAKCRKVALSRKQAAREQNHVKQLYGIQ
jgi:hypothetical protein